MKHLLDVLDEFGQPTGRQASIGEVMEKGWWYAGVRGVIYSPDGKVVIQKRSESMIQHPGMLDVSLGGFIDAGETPKQAMVRELKEELGLVIDPDDIEPAGIRKYDHHWSQHLKKTSRAFIHGYLIPVRSSDISLIVQPSEVEWARFIDLDRVKQLINHEHHDSLGRLIPIYAYYKLLIEALEKRLKVPV
ncbi:MAG TPA: NUDIX domain-containing protein [Candidatus Saccharimonadales bacterium]|nr:NUDIX domain-containing protein [Candidatus Saccharimonadales bacterium]